MCSRFQIRCFLLFLWNCVSCSPDCYDINPLLLNTTTQSPDVLKCPAACTCPYCRHNLAPGGAVITFQHVVDCTAKGLKRVPSDDLPSDAKVIILANNQITKLSTDTFKSTPNADFIDLSTNKLDHTLIDDNAFRGLSKLRKLSLTNNRAITNILKKWLEPLISLENMRAENSHVLSIEENAFRGLRNLSIVVLDNNSITKIPPELFHGLARLQRVFLQQNAIPSLPDNMFLGSSDSLLQLNIAYNQITSISEHVFLQKLTQLQQISLHNNPYSCNCAILWLRDWLLNGTTATLLEKDNIVCASGQIGVVKKGVLKFDPADLHCESRLIMTIIVICSVSVVIGALVSFIYYHRWNMRYWYQRRRLRKQYERLTQSSAPPLDQCIKYDAFISYNSEDQKWITQVLQPTLEAPPHNLTLCVDYRDFLVGEAIAQNIANSVSSSRKTVVVVSKNFVRSEWCNFELEMARNRMFDEHEDILVTILLEDVKFTSMPVLLQKVLRKRTYIEWPKEEGRKVFWTRLARAIGSPNVSLEASRIGSIQSSVLI